MHLRVVFNVIISQKIYSLFESIFLRKYTAYLSSPVPHLQAHPRVLINSYKTRTLMWDFMVFSHEVFGQREQRLQSKGYGLPESYIRSVRVREKSGSLFFFFTLTFLSTLMDYMYIPLGLCGCPYACIGVWHSYAIIRQTIS